MSRLQPRTSRKEKDPGGAKIGRYLLSLLFVAIATILSELVIRKFSPTNLIMIYMLVVVVSAIYLGRGPAILSALTGVLAFDYFFVPPIYTFTVADSEYLLSFAGFLLLGLTISYLTAEVQAKAQSAQRREAETAALYALSRDLTIADDIKTIYTALSTHIQQTLKCEVDIYIPENEKLPENHHIQGSIDDSEFTMLSNWVLQNQQPAGKGSNHFPAVEATYLPMITSLRTIGVLVLKPKDPLDQLTAEQLRLLEAFASQAAFAIEHVQLAEQSRQIQLLQATEKMQDALLNSISHDLRTPLVSITGALSTLDEQDASLDDETRQELVETAREEADRLNRLVGNLLQMTRLEAGAIRVVLEPADIEDLIGSAIGQVEDRLAERDIQIMIPPDLPMVPLDFVLIVHALGNLLDNALKYSPESSPIEIEARQLGQEVQISILDRGVGIPPDDLAHIFDKFYRVRHPEQVTGTGLGLAISKGIVEAHGGRIWATNRPAGGTMITIALLLGTNEDQ
jgi:two-component system sensor histidine kinase KdpD